MSPMLTPLIGLALAFLGLFGAAELLYHKLHVRADHTRNLVHSITGLLTLLFPLYLQQLWQVGLLCGAFLIILLASLKFGWLPSINAVKRRSQGSWLYPVVVVICFWYAQSANRGLHPYLYYSVPLLLLALGDPAAAIAGRLYRRRHQTAHTGKTFAGSAAFFAVALIVFAGAATILCGNAIAPARLIVHAAGIAAVTTAAERLSTGGWDNFTIPVTAIGYFQLVTSLQLL